MPGVPPQNGGRLMVIIPDRLSQLVAKGEVTARYYNPGEVFGEVHIVMTNDDAPDPAALQTMVGRAKLSIHNLPADKRLFVRTLGWRPWLLGPWLKRGVDLARRIGPALVRTHNNFLEGYLARTIKRSIGVPYVTSLHGVWDRDPLFANPLLDRTMRLLRRRLERETLRNADAVLAVYEPILRYAARFVGASDPDNDSAPEIVARALRYGAGVRGAQSLILASKAVALLEGRDNVGFADIQKVAKPVLRHRMIRSFEGEADGITTDQVAEALIEHVPARPEQVERASA